MAERALVQLDRLLPALSARARVATAAGGDVSGPALLTRVAAWYAMLDFAPGSSIALAHGDALEFVAALYAAWLRQLEVVVAADTLPVTTPDDPNEISVIPDTSATGARTVLYRAEVGSQPDRLGRETCSECDPGRPWSPLLTDRGVASRREADDWIAKGWVRVNGAVAPMGLQVAADAGQCRQGQVAGQVAEVGIGRVDAGPAVQIGQHLLTGSHAGDGSRPAGRHARAVGHKTHGNAAARVGGRGLHHERFAGRIVRRTRQEGRARSRAVVKTMHVASSQIDA